MNEMTHTPNEVLSHDEKIQKLRDLINGIKIAMLTTVDEEGNLRSRPMATQEVEFDGDLWFFTSDDSAKVFEITRDSQVNLSYMGDNKQVSVSGTAELTYDRAKMEKFWNDLYKLWFPKGLDDPHLALLKVHVHKAEYWEGSSGIGNLFDFVKGIVTGDADKVGENEKIDL